MFSMFQHGLPKCAFPFSTSMQWLWAAPRLLASAIHLGRLLGKFSSWSWQTTLHWWLWGGRFGFLRWKGWHYHFEKKKVSQRMTTNNIWEPEAAWTDVEAEWRLFYSFCVLMTASVCRGRIHTMWTWHLACTHFVVSAWWQGWVDQSWPYFLLLWARDHSLIGMFHMPRKTMKVQEEFILTPFKITPFERNLVLWCYSKCAQR